MDNHRVGLSEWSHKVSRVLWAQETEELMALWPIYMSKEDQYGLTGPKVPK